MPTPWQNVYGVVWGVLILRVVGLLMLAHKEPLSNTPGVASVGEKNKKKNQKKAASEMLEQAGVAWIIRKQYARPSQGVTECIQQ